MANPSRFSAAAASFARAVLDLANEKGQAAEVGQELQALRDLVQENPGLDLLLRDPSIHHEKRWQSIQRIFGGRIRPLSLNFLGVLNRKGRAALLPQIAGAYHDLLDRQLGRIEVEVTVARPLDAELREALRQTIAQSLSKDPVLHERVEESIVGGIMVRIEDRLIDGSVRRQLQKLREQLRKASGKGLAAAQPGA